MNSNRSYKFVYLGNYIINICFMVSLITLSWTNTDCPQVQKLSEMGICTMGIWMILSLWSNAFIADDKYKGKKMLDQRTVILLTFSLAIVESMMIYFVIYDNMIFLRAATALTSIWVLVLLYVIFTGKIFIPNKCTEA